ncbi:copper chaperone PCu(A)C [Leeia sp.]|uniref:copper chaperone PCu(A)C n=1 Tax=Leeia sp. TaxID=2884678 RepID=UPI0035B1A6BD
MKLRIRTLLAGGLLLASTLLHAHQFAAGKLLIVHPWAKPTVPGSMAGAIYFDIRNSGEADTLVAVSSPALAEQVEMHNHINDNGVMRMRQVPNVPITANAQAHFKPHGLHVMLMGLKQPLKLGDKLPLTLRFQKAGEVKVEVVVQAEDEPAH